MMKNLTKDCQLYNLAKAAFRKVSEVPAAFIHHVEIMGDGSIKFHFVEDGNLEHWSIDIIHLVQSQEMESK
jgi:hypothetical protein